MIFSPCRVTLQAIRVLSEFNDGKEDRDFWRKKVALSNKKTPSVCILYTWIKPKPQQELSSCQLLIYNFYFNWGKTIYNRLHSMPVYCVSCVRLQNRLEQRNCNLLTSGSVAPRLRSASGQSHFRSSLQRQFYIPIAFPRSKGHFAPRNYYNRESWLKFIIRRDDNFSHICSVCSWFCCFLLENFNCFRSYFKFWMLLVVSPFCARL